MAMGGTVPLKRPFPLRDPAPCNTRFFGLTQVCSQNGIWIGLSVYAGLKGREHTQTDWLTDMQIGHATPFVAIGRI